MSRFAQIWIAFIVVTIAAFFFGYILAKQRFTAETQLVLAESLQKEVESNLEIVQLESAANKSMLAMRSLTNNMVWYLQAQQQEYSPELMANQAKMLVESIRYYNETTAGAVEAIGDNLGRISFGGNPKSSDSDSYILFGQYYPAGHQTIPDIRIKVDAFLREAIIRNTAVSDYVDREKRLQKL